MEKRYTCKEREQVTYTQLWSLLPQTSLQFFCVWHYKAQDWNHDIPKKHIVKVLGWIVSPEGSVHIDVYLPDSPHLGVSI